MGKAYDLLLERLQSHHYKVKEIGNGRARAQCPGHGGEDLNLSIAIGDQGVLTKCHVTDCPAEDIASALGMTVADLFDEGGKATYHYAGGHTVIRKRTREGKQIIQQRKPDVTSLYQHPDSKPISEWPEVVLVEGEKCVDAALRLGEQCVTTWPGGANGVHQVDLTPLGGKYIRIIADNDEPGLLAAARLVSRLAGIATVQGVWTAPGAKQSVDDLWVDGGSLTDLVPAKLPRDPDMTPPADVPERGLALRGLGSVSSKRTRFLWDKMIPQSAVSIAAGRGGTGKSSFMIWLAAQINNGTLPGELAGEKNTVLYVSHEDSLEEVVVPRADANGVDREMFFSLGIASKELDGVVVPRLPEDLPIIRQAIAQTGAKLLIIDPITSTLAGGDNDKMADVRMVMDPLNAMAAELGIAVIGIAHFRKGGGNQSDLISGSHAWRDAARCVMLFARDDDADATVLTLEKINSGEAGKSFRYRLDIIQQITDEGTFTDVARVVWEGESVTSVGDLINHESSNKQGGLADEILEHLMAFDGRAVPMKDIVSHFAIGDVKPNTVRQNLKRLVTRGKAESPAYGQYQAVMPTPEHLARARGGVTPVQPVQVGEKLYNFDTFDTPPRARARGISDEGVDPNTCIACGHPLSASLVAAGEVRHATC